MAANLVLDIKKGGIHLNSNKQSRVDIYLYSLFVVNLPYDIEITAKKYFMQICYFFMMKRSKYKQNV
jgi:hypothetical protein